MPELPDIELYLSALKPRLLTHRLTGTRVANPFFLRTAEPPLQAVSGLSVTAMNRLGKRIVVELNHDYYLVLHLMIAGRLRWIKAKGPIPKRLGLAAFDFEHGTLVVTEAGTKRRASLHLVRGVAALQTHDPGGVEPLTCDTATFRSALLRENHTLKRCLTDPRLFSGIGNAYSDEILHRAQLSPLKWSTRLTDGEIEQLRRATIDTLSEWTKRLRDETGDAFPSKVTAFRPEMAVHGRYGMPCPTCESPVQRIVRAENEVNYCATCQTNGKVLADRSLSRLLHDDWPKTLDELERLRPKSEKSTSGTAGSKKHR